MVTSIFFPRSLNPNLSSNKKVQKFTYHKLALSQPQIVCGRGGGGAVVAQITFPLKARLLFQFLCFLTSTD